MIKREDMPEVITLEELIACALEEAYRQRDGMRQGLADGDRRGTQRVIVKLEEAALHLCDRRAREHLGVDALLDWLREI